VELCYDGRSYIYRDDWRRKRAGPGWAETTHHIVRALGRSRVTTPQKSGVSKPRQRLCISRSSHRCQPISDGSGFLCQHSSSTSQFLMPARFWRQRISGASTFLVQHASGVSKVLGSVHFAFWSSPRFPVVTYISWTWQEWRNLKQPQNSV